MTREQLIGQLTLILLPMRTLHSSHKMLRVAIDGDNYEETKSFADELRDVLHTDDETNVVRSTVGVNGTSTEKPPIKNTKAAASVRTTPLSKGVHTASSESILLVDGSGLLDGELRDEWDYSVKLLTGVEAASRDTAKMVVDFRAPTAPKILYPKSSFPKLSSIFRLRFKPLAIPLSRWMIQVALFWATSLLNNMALGFDVNVAVHIIFRSGGLCANLVLGRIMGKRYSWAQILSVVLVTVGVAAATMSSMSDDDLHTNSQGKAISMRSYSIGISILTLALFMSSAMGLAQESAYNQYGRGHWEEGLFYLHFLALPMFALVGNDLATQIKIANSSAPMNISASSMIQTLTTQAHSLFYLPTSPITPMPAPYLSNGALEKILAQAILWIEALPSVTIPSFYIPLAMNIATQLICVSGVHRLTSRVSSLTVTLVLVVRKAVSLGISVMVIGGGKGNALLWGGAAAVLLGTVIYSWDGARAKADKTSKRE